MRYKYPLPMPKGARLEFHGVDYNKMTQHVFVFRGYTSGALWAIRPEHVSSTIKRHVKQAVLQRFWRRLGAA